VRRIWQSLLQFFAWLRSTLAQNNSASISETVIQLGQGQANATPIPVPAWNDRDNVMGQFMDAWSGLEGQLFFLFRVLVGTDSQTARAIFATGIQNRDLRDLLMGLGTIKLSHTEQCALRALCGRLAGAATKRNRIVHGGWVWETEIFPDHGQNKMKSEWVRFYHPINPALMKEIMGMKRNQKVRDAHRFSIHKIADARQQIVSLSKEFGEFTSLVMKRLYPQGLPE
jgi:hypothetical protein